MNNPRYKYVTDRNGEQMPMILPRPETAAYEAYAAGQYTAMANKRRDDALQAEEAGRQATSSSIAPMCGSLSPEAFERIRQAIEDQED